MNRTISMLAAFAILVGCAIQALAALFYLAPLVILQSGNSLRAFDTAQQQHLALVFVNLSTETFHLYLIFFGLWCVLTGYLIFRSTFLPGILVGQLSGQGGYPFVNALKSDQRGAGASAGRPLRNWRRT